MTYKKIEFETGQTLTGPDEIMDEFLIAWNGDPKKAAKMTCERLDRERERNNRIL
jgi:hypothetical protein